jgi:hypothetical protein
MAAWRCALRLVSVLSLSVLLGLIENEIDLVENRMFNVVFTTITLLRLALLRHWREYWRAAAIVGGHIPAAAAYTYTIDSFSAARRETAHFQLQDGTIFSAHQPGVAHIEQPLLCHVQSCCGSGSKNLFSESDARVSR